MADRFPLILNTSANQIQEIASGDSLDLTGSNISNAGIITAGNVTIGAATTDLIVNGDARITGILTIGTSSLKLDGLNNLVNVGTALTLGHTQGLQFHTQNLHSAGFEVNQINVSGASTMGGDVTFTGDNYNVLWDKSQNILEFADNAKVSFGSGGDLFVFHDGSNSFLQDAGTGTLFLDCSQTEIKKFGSNHSIAKFIGGGAVELYHNNTKRFETTTSGVTVTGDGTFTGNVSVGGTLTYEDVTNIDSVGIITARAGINLTGGNITLGDTSDGSSDDLLIFGAGSDLKIYHDSNHSYIQNATGDLFIKSNADDLVLQAADDVLIRPQNGEDGIKVIGNGGVELYNNGTKKFETDGNGITVQGNINMATDSTLYLGVGNDFRLFHNGTTNYIRSTNGNIHIDDNSGVLNAKFIPAGASELYHNGNKKFETSSSGAIVTGQLVADNGLKVNDGNHITLGTDNDLRLYFDGSNSAWNNQVGNSYFYGGGGNFYIRPVNAEQGLNIHANGSIELFHDNAKKVETFANGIIVYGPEGGGGLINLYADEGDDNADKWRLHANPNGSFYLQNYTSGSWENSISAAGNSGTSLYFDNVVTLTTTVNALHLFGNANECNIDLKLSNGNRCGFLGFTNSGRVQINGAAGGNPYETYLEGNLNGSTKLFYDNTVRIETLTEGAKVKRHSGGSTTLYVEGAEGGSAIIDMFADDGDDNADKYRLLSSSGGGFYLQNYSQGGWQNNISINNNLGVDLYYTNTKRFETYDSGVKVTGDLALNHSSSTTETTGFAVQRIWSPNITAGNAYKCGQWYEGEGAVQLYISVRSVQGGHSGSATYLFQGGYASIGGQSTKRLLPLASGRGHGNGPDTGMDSNAWEVLIDNINDYTYALYVHIPSGQANKIMQIAVTEMNRGNTFTDMSSTVAYSSLPGTVTTPHLTSLQTSHAEVVRQHLLPAFRVGRGSSDQNVGSGDAILFNYTSGSQSYFNQGGHYSPSTGRFTAPFAGVYHFYALVIFEQVSDNTDMTDSWDFYMNSSQLAFSARRAKYRADYTGTSGYFTDPATITIYMNKDDYIWCRNKYAGKIIHSNPTYSYFCGHFVG